MDARRREKERRLTSLKSSYLFLQFSQYPGFLFSSRSLGGGSFLLNPASRLALLFSFPRVLPPLMDDRCDVEVEGPPRETTLRDKIASRLST